MVFFFFSSRRRHTISLCDWSSDVCSSDLLPPSAAVIVATVRALKYHGGVELADLKHENLAALDKGVVNLERRSEERRVGKECRSRWERRTERKEEHRNKTV